MRELNTWGYLWVSISTVQWVQLSCTAELGTVVAQSVLTSVAKAMTSLVSSYGCPPSSSAVLYSYNLASTTSTLQSSTWKVNRGSCGWFLPRLILIKTGRRVKGTKRGSKVGESIPLIRSRRA